MFKNIMIAPINVLGSHELKIVEKKTAETLR